MQYLTRKSFFPYEYVTSEEKLTETRELPPKEDFYSTLTDAHISDENYAFAQSVWQLLEEKTLLAYSLFYMKLDILLLAAFYEKFRDACMSSYRLDPTNYVSLPSFSLDAALIETKAEIELITDPDIFSMINSSIRGGLTQLNLRYCEANNKYMKNYDANKRDVYLMYYDVNSLYSYAIC